MPEPPRLASRKRSSCIFKRLPFVHGEFGLVETEKSFTDLAIDRVAVEVGRFTPLRLSVGHNEPVGADRGSTATKFALPF